MNNNHNRMYALGGNPISNPNPQGRAALNVQSYEAPISLRAFPTHYGLTPEVVEPVIKEQFEKCMKKLQHDEDTYVDLNLRETPAICMRRLMTTAPDEPCEPSLACDRCEINNRIKKTKFKLRVRFMGKKLGENVVALQKIRKFVKAAEEKALRQGRTQEELDELRRVFGVDNVRVENLPETNGLYFNPSEKEFIVRK